MIIWGTSVKRTQCCQQCGGVGNVVGSLKMPHFEPP